ncbi:Hypothetical predicted protein [Pelobates cultripes]|uniref:Endonuclease/exonuclease/phosphatase family domain containing protein 1 n=1 Tax=Pelobates cultripes TaxID=61616 RepID=A0AAD1TD89_PELCU|nr:Hypothetical predicted protein [Pelobates cultripes]
MGASVSCRRGGHVPKANALCNRVISPESCVDINQATEEELMTLPGINRNLAQSITIHRRKLGGFRRVEDLALVTGVGAERMLILRPELCVRKQTRSQIENNGSESIFNEGGSASQLSTDCKQQDRTLQYLEVIPPSKLA